MATASYPARRQPCALRLQLIGDGTALVQCGTQDMGSGTYTALARAAAERLGLAVGQVAVELGDTLLPQGPISAGSQVTQSFAPAMATAVARLRAQIAALLAADRSPFGEVSAEDLEFADGAVRRRGANASLPLADLLRDYAPGGLEARGEGARHARPEPAFTGMGFGAVFAEVAIDPLLGEVRVRRLTGAYAAGRILNPTPGAKPVHQRPGGRPGHGLAGRDHDRPAHRAGDGRQPRRLHHPGERRHAAFETS